MSSRFMNDIDASMILSFNSVAESGVREIGSIRKEQAAFAMMING